MIGNTRAKLAARNFRFPEIDLEAWYNAAWHGLYQAIVDGADEIDNPGGWLVVAMERRAIDDVRRLSPDRLVELPEGSKLAEGVIEPDIAGQLDDLDRIRRWRSGIRLRLSRRERQAAVLHFIQGFSRIETARLLRVPPRRADKIFDSITSKTAGLLTTIEDGSWCDAERSLMVAFSAGVLDPAGERHAVALQHVSECPGCAAFVRRRRNAYLIIPAPALAGVATAAGSGALGAALGLAEVTSTGAGAGVTAGGAGLFGGLTAKTATMCASAVCLTGAGAGVAVVENVRPSRPPEARAARAPNRADRNASPTTTAIGPKSITASLPQPTPSAAVADPPPATPQASASPPRPATPRRRSAPETRQAAAAAQQRQQEDELGIEPASTPPPTNPSSSGASGASSTTSASSPSASGASSGDSSSAPTSPPPKTAAAPRTPPADGGGTEFGIEP